MSQLRYKILQALRTPLHLRALARTINQPVMTTQRTIQQLIKENILHKHTEGKNNIYQIKTTLQARNAQLQAELHSLTTFANAHPELTLLIRDLMKHNTLTLIFGSYAKGTEKSTSDIDIYTETKDKRIIKELRSLPYNIHLQTGDWNTTTIFKEMEDHHVIIRGFERYHDLTQPPLGSILFPKSP